LFRTWSAVIPNLISAWSAGSGWIASFGFRRKYAHFRISCAPGLLLTFTRWLEQTDPLRRVIRRRARVAQTAVLAATLFKKATYHKLASEGCVPGPPLGNRRQDRL